MDWRIGHILREALTKVSIKDEKSRKGVLFQPHCRAQRKRRFAIDKHSTRQTNPIWPLSSSSSSILESDFIGFLVIPDQGKPGSKKPETHPVKKLKVVNRSIIRSTSTNHVYIASTHPSSNASHSYHLCNRFTLFVQLQLDPSRWFRIPRKLSRGLFLPNDLRIPFFCCCFERKSRCIISLAIVYSGD